MVVEALSARNSRLTDELRRLRKFAELVRARERSMPLVYRIHGSGMEESESMELVSPSIPHVDDELDERGDHFSATQSNVVAPSARLVDAAVGEIAQKGRSDARGPSSAASSSAEACSSRASDLRSAAQTTYTI
jgi:hypothetical protein